jgi:hypothetical protein
VGLSILENQSSGVFVLPDRSWWEVRGRTLDWPMHTGREVSPSGLKPNSRKTPPLKRRAELLGTIALHWSPLGLMCCIKRLSVFRWLTHTGREVSPSGLKPNSR